MTLLFMKFNREDYLKRNSGVKTSIFISFYLVPLKKLEEISGVDKSFFTQVSRKRANVDLEPIWKPVVPSKDQEQDKDERKGVSGFWKLTYPDLFYFMVLDSLRDFKSGYQRAFCSFMVYHMLYIDFKKENENFLDNVFTAPIDYKLVVVTKKFVPKPQGKMSQSFKDSGLKLVHHFMVLKNGKLCTNYLYLTGEHNTYVPSINPDIEKCQLAYLETCFNEVESKITLEINLSDLSKRLRIKILNSGIKNV